MKKVFLWLLVISMVALFSLAGCKAEEAEVVEAEEVEVAEGEELVETEIPEEYQCGINWRQFEGQEIDLLIFTHPWQEAIMPYIPEFESLTGIKVNWSKLPHEEIMTRINADFTAGTFAYDVFMGVFFDAPLFTLNEWTASLEEFLNDPKLTDSEWYNFNDFFDSALQLTSWGKYRDRIPITTEASIFIYRKDIFEELNLQVPTTFDELLVVVKTISDSDLNIYGTTVRGGPAIWYPFYGMVRSFGGDYWTENDEVKINSPGSVAALEALIELAKYSPPGVTDYGWDQINTAILSGTAATFIDSSVIYSRLEDPETSTVVGKIGAAPYPEGPAGRQSLGHYWSICISNLSEKKPQSWLFIEWATSEPMQRKLAIERKLLPPRDSIWDDPDFISAYPSDYIEAMDATLPTSVNMNSSPQSGAVIYELFDVLTRKAQEAILGQKDAQKAMDECATEWEKILKP